MTYSERDRHAIDRFALFLIGIGLWFLAMGSWSYFVRPTYLPKMFGLQHPTMLLLPTLAGIAFVLLGSALSLALKRESKPYRKEVVM